MNKIIRVVLAVAVVIAIGGAYKFPQVLQFGSNPGPEFYNHLTFRQNFSNAGEVVATSSTAATYTLTTNEIRREVSYISWLVNVNTTLTTMASTSAPLSNLAVGESFTMYFYNASTTAAATATFAEGTGVDLQETTGGVVVVNGLELAKLTFLKKANTDVFLFAEVGQVGQ